MQFLVKIITGSLAYKIASGFRLELNPDAIISFPIAAKINKKLIYKNNLCDDLSEDGSYGGNPPIGQSINIYLFAKIRYA